MDLVLFGLKELLDGLPHLLHQEFIKNRVELIPVLLVNRDPCKRLRLLVFLLNDLDNWLLQSLLEDFVFAAHVQIIKEPLPVLFVFLSQLLVLAFRERLLGAVHTDNPHFTAKGGHILHC